MKSNKIKILILAIASLAIITGCSSNELEESTLDLKEETTIETEAELESDIEEEVVEEEAAEEVVVADDVKEENSEDLSDNSKMNEKLPAMNADSNPVFGNNIVEFNTIDMDGNGVDGSILSESKLTVLNLWATWCGPCISEMPMLESVSREYADKGVNFLGVVVSSEQDQIVKVIDELEITYDIIDPDEVLIEKIANEFAYIPVTLFIDSEGNILEFYIPGSTNEELLTEVLDIMLENMDD